MLNWNKFEPLPIEQVEALLAHKARLNKFSKQFQSDSPFINYSQAHHMSSAISSDGFSLPNKTNPKSFPAFCGGSGRGSGSSHCRGGGAGHGRSSGHFANFQSQVCFKFGHTASVCNYRYDQYYQPNLSFVLHDPLSPSYSQTTSTQTSNNYTSYSQNSNSSGQNSGDTRPANVWTNTNYKSVSNNPQSNHSAIHKHSTSIQFYQLDSRFWCFILCYW